MRHKELTHYKSCCVQRLYTFVQFVKMIDFLRLKKISRGSLNPNDRQLASVLLCLSLSTFLFGNLKQTEQEIRYASTEDRLK
jgi:hypothetical protein